MTPSEFIGKSIIEFPSLYATIGNYDLSKLKVLDHLYNVIGNGVSTRSIATSKYVLNEELLHRILHEVTYTGYTKLDDGYVDFSGKKYDLVFESDKHKYPKVLKWVPTRYVDAVHLYPNFTKKYSLIWEYLDNRAKNKKSKLMSNEWLSAARWYYAKARDYFNGDCSTYPYAYPCETTHMSNGKVKELTAIIINGFNNGEFTSNEDVTAAFEVEFKGIEYIEELLLARWEKEKSRILSFIDETLLRLDAEIQESNQLGLGSYQLIVSQ